MKKGNYFLKSILFASLFSTAFVGGASASEITGKDLTPEQQLEVQQGIEDTKLLTESYRAEGALLKGSLKSPVGDTINGPVGNVPYGSLGNTGDILITMSGSSSTEMPVGGHAAIAVDRYNTIEAMGVRNNNDGVRYWSNNFKSRYSDGHSYRVAGASSTQKARAVDYAQNQLYEPYNYNFFNKTRTDAWYCSQLVWAAWKSQGYNLDYNGGNAVWPADLAKSNNVY